MTGHIAIVEGIFYDSAKQRYYIRLVEAIDPEGVVRSVLDDERVSDRKVTLLRVSGATDIQKSAAVSFCISQLGKAYNLNFGKGTSKNEADWYCSELVWAAYKNQGIDIEVFGWGEPGITPYDILKSSQTSTIAFKK